jgi:hypothetical protein
LYDFWITTNLPQNISCAGKQLQKIDNCQTTSTEACKLQWEQESKNYLVIVRPAIFRDCSWEDSILITPQDMNIDRGNLQ